MDEFKLAEAALDIDGLSVSFKRKTREKPQTEVVTDSADYDSFEEAPAEPAAPAAVVGTPISSPMTGIFYASPSPNSPAFVKEGDMVTTGQIIGLIEAMKVFNEIPSPISGIAKKVVAESGQIVNPGDVLVLIA